MREYIRMQRIKMSSTSANTKRLTSKKKHVQQQKIKIKYYKMHDVQNGAEAQSAWN